MKHCKLCGVNGPYLIEEICKWCRMAKNGEINYGDI